MTQDKLKAFEEICTVSPGTHLCQFYETQQDLISIVVPFLYQGLINQEQCLFVVSDLNHQEKIYQALKQVMPDLDSLIEKKMMSFVDRKIALPNPCPENIPSIIQNFFTMEREALVKGFTGLRMAGAPVNLQQGNEWRGICELESAVDKHLPGHTITALCCYSLQHCGARAILDVIKTHEYAMMRINDQWKIIENANIKVLKEKLNELNVDLEHQVQVRTQELALALKARDEFISIASHELKTPLTSLRLYIDGMLLNNQETHISQAELSLLLKRMKKQCLHLESITNDLLDVTALLGDEKLHINKEEMDLRLPLNNVIDRLGEEIKAAKCKIEYHAPQSIIGCWDKSRIDQIFSNLLLNAIKYAPGQIKITLASQDDFAILTVQDFGAGIKQVDHSRIFNRFVRLSQETWGLGLGLWIVRKITEAHQGTIELHSVVNEGSAFTVKLPLQ